jgi:ABC-type uncharacterized transport system substrate-binding protein
LVKRIASQAPGGIEIVKARVDSVADVVPAMSRLLQQAKAVWIIGDPALSRGAAFEFVIEQSLARKVPVIAPSPWGVEHGALFCSTADVKKLAVQAADSLRGVLQANLSFSGRPVETASGGALLVNVNTQKSLGLKLPPGFLWQPLP